MGATALLALALAHASFVQACAIDACTCSFKFAAVHTSISDTQERPELVLNGCYDSRDLAMCPISSYSTGKCWVSLESHQSCRCCGNTYNTSYGR